MDRMYSIDDLLELVNAERADELRIHVGAPPIIVLQGDHETIEGPAITAEDAEQLLQSIANTRQRRELRERGAVRFIYRFRRSTDFVVCARMEGESIGIDIH